jgi:hypothetical protein
MFEKLLQKLFPESLFPRRLQPGTERRLRLAQARAEEALVRAHVENALGFVEVLADELQFDRALATYVRVMGVPEPLASVIVTRSLVVLGRDLLPAGRPEAAPVEEFRPKLRLAEVPERAQQPRRA